MKLKNVRAEKGISQSQLSEKTGIGVRMIQNYEQGQNDLNGARLCTLLKLCNALDCRLSDILDDPETLEELRKYGEH